MALTTVMYHYVRPLGVGPYPNIKGLDVELFRAQVEYLAAHYVPVSVDDVIESVHAGDPLPDAAVLLTFDDGYLDHFEHAFPILADAGIQGAFYAPAGAVLERRVLDVNKIQFIVSMVENPARLVDAVELAVEQARDEFETPDLKELRRDHRSAFRYDGPDTMYVKRLLQFALPSGLRARVTDSLFRQFVSRDETDFAETLYVNADQLTIMVQAGMHVGGHGGRHVWLSRLSDDEKDDEIEQSARLVNSLGADQKFMSFCYPYGDFDDDVQRRVAERSFAAAFTTRMDVVGPGPGNIMALPRIDTNELPKDASAEPANCRWWVANRDASTGTDDEQGAKARTH